MQELENEYRDRFQFDRFVPVLTIALSCATMICLTIRGGISLSPAQFIFIGCVTLMQPLVYRATLGFDRQISARLQEILERHATP
ncbi:MAG: hypothetical protein J0H82_27070 [Alphaproteobacteria bacterium]|jgi:hypothetical protein|nr:hypothetical protein [Alphaproteobacteria bacterium]